MAVLCKFWSDICAFWESDIFFSKDRLNWGKYETSKIRWIWKIEIWSEELVDGYQTVLSNLGLSFGLTSCLAMIPTHFNPNNSLLIIVQSFTPIHVHPRLLKRRRRHRFRERVCSSCLLGVTNRVCLGMSSLKRSTAGACTAHFRVLSQKIWQEIDICCFRKRTSWGWNNSKPCPQNRILGPLWVSFQNFQWKPLSYLYGSPSPGFTMDVI